MFITRRKLGVALWCCAWVVLTALPTVAENEDSQAVQLLLKAQLQFQNMDYLSARKTLWKAYAQREGLSDPQRKLLADRLGEVDHAIQQQVIARALHKTAHQAAEAGDWQLARDAYAKVADCPYLPMETRSSAKAELAKAEMKLAEQLATEGPDALDAKPMNVIASPPPPGEPAGTQAPAEPASADVSEAVQPVEPQPLDLNEDVAPLSEEVAAAKDDSTFTAPEPIEEPPAEAPTASVDTETEEVVVAGAPSQPSPITSEPLAQAAPAGAIAEIEPVGAKASGENDGGEIVEAQQLTVEEPAPISEHDQPAGITPAPQSDGPALAGEMPTGQQARQIKVEMLLSEGRAALNQNQPEKAVDYFSQAQQLDPDNPMIVRELNNARMLTAQPADAGILSDYRRQQRIAKQIAEHDFTQALDRSNELMAQPADAETFDAAEQAAQSAQNVLQNNKRLFPTTEYREKLAKVDDQLKWIREKRETYNRKKVLQTMQEIEQANLKRQEQMKVRRQQKVAELTARAHALRRDRKYQQALEVIRQIVQIDPNNPWAKDSRIWLEQHILLQQQKRFNDKGNTELAKLAADIRATEIPWYDLVRYSRDWKDLTARRMRFSAGVAAETDENRRVRQKLDSTIGQVRLVDVKFEEAVTYLREVSGASFYVNWGALEVDNPDIRNQQVNVVLDNVSVETVLEKILAEAGGGILQLGYVIDKGVVNISTQEKLSIEVYPRVYDIRDLLTRIPNFVGPRVQLSAIGELDVGGDSSTSGSSSSSGGEGIWDDEGDDDTDSGREGESMTKQEMVQLVQTMISTTIDRDSWYPNGNASINELNGQLIITQTAKNHRLVQELIAKMREARTIQISIEARFITVNTGFLSQIGVDLDFYFNIGSEIGGPDTTNPLTGGAFATGPQGSTTDPYTGASVPLRRISAWNQAGNNADASLRKMSPISVGQGSSAFANVFNQSTNVPNGIGSLVTAPAMSIAGTFLDDLQVDFLIQATQAHSATRTLTAPRVTLFNGQRAYVSIATQQAYISGVEPIVSENAVALQPIINYAPTGTMLDVDATVSHDRRYVTMTVRPQIVTLNANIREVPVISGGSFISIGLPNITLQDIQTTVSVPDGGTLLIGGQKLSGEVEREMGVPVISKLPVINRAFTNKGKLRDEQTLLILIKPQIIIQDEVEEQPERRVEEPTFSTRFGG